VLEESPDVEENAEHADRARDGKRVGNDRIGRRRDHVAARSGIITHRDNHGLFFSREGNFTPHRIGSGSSTPGRIAAHHDTLEFVAFAGISHGLHERLGAHLLATENWDAVGPAFTAYERTDRVDDGYLAFVTPAYSGFRCRYATIRLQRNLFDVL